MITFTTVVAAAEGGLVDNLAHTAHELGETFGIEPSYIAWQAASFLILAFVLYRFAFKPVLATIDERQQKIEEGLKHADSMKLRLEEAEAEKKKVIQEASIEAKKIVDEARAQAEARIEKSAQEAIEQAEGILKRAEAQIDLDRKNMLAEVRSEIARLVVDTASKVLSKDLSADEKSRYNASASANLVESSN